MLSDRYLVYGTERMESYTLDQDRLGLILSLYLLGHLFCSVLTCNVVDGQVAAFSGELLRYKCT